MINLKPLIYNLIISLQVIAFSQVALANQTSSLNLSDIQDQIASPYHANWGFRFKEDSFWEGSDESELLNIAVKNEREINPISLACKMLNKGESFNQKLHMLTSLNTNENSIRFSLSSFKNLLITHITVIECINESGTEIKLSELDFEDFYEKLLLEKNEL